MPTDLLSSEAVQMKVTQSELAFLILGRVNEAPKAAVVSMTCYLT